MSDQPNYRPETLAIHAGQKPDPATNARAVPIYATTRYVFDDADHAARLFGLQEFGNIYTRIMNPTTGVFEERVAALEGGVGALALASGQAAETAHDPQPRPRRRQHRQQRQPVRRHLQPVPVHAAQARHHDPTSWTAPTRPTSRRRSTRTRGRSTSRRSATRAWTSPTSRRSPTWRTRTASRSSSTTPSRRSSAGRSSTAPTSSSTRRRSGSAATAPSIGGVVVDGGTFDWTASARFPDFVEPDPSYHGVSYTEAFGPLAFILKLRVQVLRDLGGRAQPVQRVPVPAGPRDAAAADRAPQRERAGGRPLAASRTPGSTWVSYPGLASHPAHAHAKRYLTGRLRRHRSTFGVKGGVEAGRTLIDNVKLFSLLANVGDAKSLIIHPATTTHQQLSAEDQLATGVTDGPRPALDRPRARRRHHRRPRPGARDRDERARPSARAPDRCARGTPAPWVASPRLPRCGDGGGGAAGDGRATPARLGVRDGPRPRPRSRAIRARSGDAPAALHGRLPPRRPRPRRGAAGARGPRADRVGRRRRRLVGAAHRARAARSTPTASACCAPTCSAAATARPGRPSRPGDRSTVRRRLPADLRRATRPAPTGPARRARHRRARARRRRVARRHGRARGGARAARCGSVRGPDRRAGGHGRPGDRLEPHPAGPRRPARRRRPRRWPASWR